MDALSLSPSVDGTAASSSAPGTLVVAAPPSVLTTPIDAAARAVANRSQTPAGDASKSTRKRKAMEQQQTELSTTCPVCKHTAGHVGESIVVAPCCDKQLYCRACATDLITKGFKQCLHCTKKLPPLRDFNIFDVSEIENPTHRTLIQDFFDMSRRCDTTRAPTPAAAAVVPGQCAVPADPPGLDRAEKRAPPEAIRVRLSSPLNAHACRIPARTSPPTLPLTQGRCVCRRRLWQASCISSKTSTSLHYPVTKSQLGR